MQNVTVDDACCVEGTRFISGARKIDYPSDPSARRNTQAQHDARRRRALKQDALFLLRLWQRYVYDINAIQMYYEPIYKDKTSCWCELRPLRSESYVTSPGMDCYFWNCPFRYNATVLVVLFSLGMGMFTLTRRL